MKKTIISILIFASGCGFSYDSGSDSRVDSQEINDSQVNQPTTTVFSGGDSEVDTSLDVSNGEGLAVAENSEDCAELVKDGPGGFTYKPVSDEDKNLVILLPPKVSFDYICGVFILENSQMENCEKRFSISEEEDGSTREVFRFDQPGGSYISEFKAKKGEKTCVFQIPNTSERYDRSVI